MLASSGLAPGGHPPQGTQLVLATSQAYHAPMLSRSPIFHTLSPSILGRTSSCHLPLSCQPTPGGNGQPLVLTLAEAPGQNPGEVVWPLHLPQILDPTGEGCIEGKGQGSPLAAPCGASCFIPGIFSCDDPDSESGHRCPASLGWWTGSVSLFSPSRQLWQPGPSDGLPSPWQDPSWWRFPSFPSWGFYS